MKPRTKIKNNKTTQKNPTPINKTEVTQLKNTNIPYSAINI